MPQLKNREPRKHFGMAYYESTNRVDITVPDAIDFPSTSAWAWLRDCHTMVLSPDKPDTARGATQTSLRKKDALRGARYCHVPMSRGMGEPFRMTDVSYRYVDGRFYLRVPDPDDRKPPIVRRRPGDPVEKKTRPSNVVAARFPENLRKTTVMVDLGDRSAEFLVPVDEVAAVVGRWVLDGYAVTDGG